MICIHFFGKIDLISKIIDLNGDSSYIILSYFLKISYNSSFLMFFPILYLSYLQFSSFHALIILLCLIDPYLIRSGEKNYKKKYLQKSKKKFLLILLKKVLYS